MKTRNLPALSLLLALLALLASNSPAPGYPLESWSFNDTNSWTTDLGYPPVTWTNLAVSNLGDGTNGNALVLDSTNAAFR